MLCLPLYFLLSDSSALDTQVFSHYYHQLCAFVVFLHVHVLVDTFVLCLVVWNFVEFVTPLNLGKTQIWALLFLNWSPICRCECSMCLWAILLSRCDACPFITILFERMICVSDWVFWSARRERYTIDKSGPKRQERQNSQSWAHKLHWGGIILYFALSSPLFLISFPLSYPKLTSECVGFEKLLVYLLFFTFTCCDQTILLDLLLLYICVACLCSLAVFWIPKCSACRLEGEWQAFDHYTLVPLYSILYMQHQDIWIYTNAYTVYRYLQKKKLKPFLRHEKKNLSSYLASTAPAWICRKLWSVLQQWKPGTL